MITGANCKGCCFYSPHPTMPQRGQCRHGSPKVDFQKLDTGEKRTRTVWPLVKDWDWCGQHGTEASHG